MAVSDITRDKKLRTQFLDDGLVNANGKALKDLDIAYTETADVSNFLSDSEIDGATPYVGNKAHIEAALRGEGGENGIIDIILSNEGFTGDNKIPDEIKDLLIAEATSFGTIINRDGTTQPKDVTEIIKNLLHILERYDSEKDKNFGDVAHDDTVSGDTALNRYFSDSNFKAIAEDTREKIKKGDAFSITNFDYTKADKREIRVLLNDNGKNTSLETKYNEDTHLEVIRASIDKMTDGFVIDPAIKDKLIAEAVSLGNPNGGTFTIAELLNNIAKVLERYDNNADEYDNSVGDMDKDARFFDDKGAVKDRDLFLKNKLSDKNLKDDKKQAFVNSDFVYGMTDKTQIRALLTDEFDLTAGMKTKYDSNTHKEAVNASIDLMTGGFTLDSATKAQLIAEAVSLGNPKGGNFTIAELLDNISKVLERYDNNVKDKNYGDIDKDSQVDSNIQTSFSGLKTKDGKTFSTVEYDFGKEADKLIDKSENDNTVDDVASATLGYSTLAYLKDNGKTNVDSKKVLEEAIIQLFKAAGVMTVPEDLLKNIILEAKTLGDATGGTLTVADMLKNAAKVIERYDNNAKDKNHGDVAHNGSIVEDDEALKHYFANLADSDDTIFSDVNFGYSKTDKINIEKLSTKWDLETQYKSSNHKDAIYKSIDEMTNEFSAVIDPAIKDRLIAEARSLGDANGGTFTIGELLTNIAKILERYDYDVTKSNTKEDYGNASKDKNLKRDTALERTFTSSAFTNDDDIAFSDTNFVYNAEGMILTSDMMTTDKYDYNSSKTQKAQITVLKAAIDTMFGEFVIDDATKDQLIAEALSFDPLKEINLGKILANIASIAERYDNDKADKANAPENVGDVLNDSVAQAEIKAALKDVDFKKEATITTSDKYISDTTASGYAAQHAQILEKIDILVTDAVTLSVDTKELLIAQAAAMTDPTSEDKFTVGDLLENIKKLLEKNDNDADTSDDITFGNLTV